MWLAAGAVYKESIYEQCGLGHLGHLSLARPPLPIRCKVLFSIVPRNRKLWYYQW